VRGSDHPKFLAEQPKNVGVSERAAAAMQEQQRLSTSAVKHLKFDFAELYHVSLKRVSACHDIHEFDPAMIRV